MQKIIQKYIQKHRQRTVLLMLLQRWIRHMLYNIFNVAVQDSAYTIQSIDFYVFIFTETIQQRAVDPIVSIKRVLGNATLFHCFP